jgi:hypothetical protein
MPGPPVRQINLTTCRATTSETGGPRSPSVGGTNVRGVLPIGSPGAFRDDRTAWPPVPVPPSSSANHAAPVTSTANGWSSPQGAVQGSGPWPCPWAIQDIAPLQPHPWLDTPPPHRIPAIAKSTTAPVIAWSTE